MQTLFTLGYQGHSIASFSEVLLAHGITMIIDVRERPYSRKPDFSKKRLSAHLAAEGIAYVHLVELGTPKPIRDEVRRSKNYAAFFAAVRPLIEASVDAGGAQSAIVLREANYGLQCTKGAPAWRRLQTASR